MEKSIGIRACAAASNGLADIAVADKSRYLAITRQFLFIIERQRFFYSTALYKVKFRVLVSVTNITGNLGLLFVKESYTAIIFKLQGHCRRATDQ